MNEENRPGHSQDGEDTTPFPFAMLVEHVELYLQDFTPNTLLLSNKQGDHGLVGLAEGRVVHAETDTYVGAEAFYRLLTWESGFLLSREHTVEQVTILIDFDELLERAKTRMEKLLLHLQEPDNIKTASEMNTIEMQALKTIELNQEELSDLLSITKDDTFNDPPAVEVLSNNPLMDFHLDHAEKSLGSWLFHLQGKTIHPLDSNIDSPALETHAQQILSLVHDAFLQDRQNIEVVMLNAEGLMCVLRKGNYVCVQRYHKSKKGLFLTALLRYLHEE